MPKHTPGPWRVGSVDKHQVFVPCADCLGPERVLLNMNYHFPYDDDARLIAAAPEMYKLLRSFADGGIPLEATCALLARIDGPAASTPEKP